MRRQANASAGFEDGTPRRCGTRLPGRPVGIVIAAVCSLLMLAIGGTSASAAALHPFEGSVGVGELASPAGVAVDNANGSLYVADPGLGSIRKYDAGGAPANFSGLGSNELPVSTRYVAVDNSSGPSAGTIYVTSQSTVQAFDANGEPAPFTATAPYVSGNRLTGTPTEAFRSNAAAVAVGANGDIYVDDFFGVYVYSPAGEYLATAPAFFAEAVAVDSAGNVYASPNGSEVQRYTPSEYPVTTATTYSSARVKALPAYGIAADPSSGDLFVNGNGRIGQYGSAAESNLEKGTFGAAQLAAGSNSVAIDRSGGANDGSVYVSAGSRVVRFGPSPAPVAPTVETETAVPTETEAELRAKLDTGNDDVTYHFEYGPSASYGSSTETGRVSASESSVQVKATILGLTPESEYHFRVVIENSVERVEGSDQSFRTPGTSNVEFCSDPTPGCWGFEQVTPVEKGAGTVSTADTFRPSPDGERFLYTTQQPFSSVPAESSGAYVRYLGTRGPDSWFNRALDPAYDLGAGSGAQFNVMTLIASSVDLSHALVTSTIALTPGATEGGSNLYVRDTSTGALTLVATAADPALAHEFYGLSGELGAKYIAPDGRSVLFGSAYPLLPEVPEGVYALYGWTADGGLRVESKLPAAEGGQVVEGLTTISSEEGARQSAPQRDGMSHVYFTGRVNFEPGPVYVRTAGVTKVVSVSHIPGDPTTPVPAVVESVTDGGRYMLFRTTEGNKRLTPDTPTNLEGNPILYRYDFANDSLAYVGTQSTFGSVGVIQMSNDGQTVAFSTNEALGGMGVVDPQQLNMYVWHAGSLQYVETPEQKSSATTSARFLRVLSANGRYLSFTDSSISTAQRFGYDNFSAACPPPLSYDPGGCNEAYLYDTETEQLSCVSCNPDGSAPTGNAGDPRTTAPGYIRMDGHQMQTVSDDGRVFFTTPDSLLPADGNGLDDVYESHDGRLRLVSRATQGTSARFLDATPDGRSIFIATNDPIAPTDTDKATDIYMTREGAGYAYAPAAVKLPCTGGDCRGATSPTPQSQPPASIVGFNPGSREKGVRKVSVAKTKAISGPSGSIKARVPSRGRLAVAGAGLLKRTKAVERPGTYSIPVSLTSSQAKALRRSGKVRRKVRVTFTPSEGRASSVILRITFQAADQDRAGR